MKKTKYKRVIIKISGEALAGNWSYGIDPDTVEEIAQQIMEAANCDVQVGVVVGGGNIWRGYAASKRGMDRATADYMGMLATVMNAMAIQDALEKKSAETRVLTAIEMKDVAEPYIRRRAIRHLEKGRIVIFAAGTGNPFFSTDTAAALRAAEVEAEIILMAKKVDGVYDSDPLKNSNAKKYEKLDHMEVLNKGLGVMDATAASLCMDNGIPMIVFNLKQKGNIMKVLMGDAIGTFVGGER